MGSIVAMYESSIACAHVPDTKMQLIAAQGYMGKCWNFGDNHHGTDCYQSTWREGRNAPEELDACVTLDFIVGEYHDNEDDSVQCGFYLARECDGEPIGASNTNCPNWKNKPGEKIQSFKCWKP
ncbi:hypothetical protein V8F06_007827 [Rhypophila decipiens]